MSIPTVHSIDIPQADDLNVVFRLVELIATGREVRPQELGVVKRQVSYYSHAARILGLLDDDGEPTQLGRRILVTDRRARAREASLGFAQSAVGMAWTAWSGRPVTDLNPESAERFIRAVSDLEESTVQRRALTLRSWVRQFNG
jgi:hypothetical protein